MNEFKPVRGLMSSCFCFSISEAVRDIVKELLDAADGLLGALLDGLLGGLADAGEGGTATVATERWMAVLCGSVTTVIDRLFLPGRMYVSLTQTMPSSRLALTPDDVTDEQDEDMDATVVTKSQIYIYSCINIHPS